MMAGARDELYALWCEELRTEGTFFACNEYIQRLFFN